MVVRSMQTIGSEVKLAKESKQGSLSCLSGHAKPANEGHLKTGQR
jgi:hypothetical protein